MPVFIYKILNIFFFIFHTSLILFNLIGWSWRKTRLYNLITLGLTGFSWFGLGIWYGFGFCPSTEWHWQVRLHLGDYHMPHSYIQFLLQKLTGVHAPETMLNQAVLALFLLALTASLGLNLRDWRRKKEQKKIFHT